MFKNIEAFTKHMQANGVAAFSLDNGQLKPLNPLAETCSVVLHNAKKDGSFQVTEFLRTEACQSKIKSLLEKPMPLQ
jgi:hypothetical protein